MRRVSDRFLARSQGWFGRPAVRGQLAQAVVQRLDMIGAGMLRLFHLGPVRVECEPVTRLPDELGDLVGSHVLEHDADGQVPKLIEPVRLETGSLEAAPRTSTSRHWSMNPSRTDSTTSGSSSTTRIRITPPGAVLPPGRPR